MPPKVRTSLKPKMRKKIRLPQAISRETIGKGNNKRNDKNKSGNDQAKLNYIANNTGQTLAPDSLLTLDGFLYLYSICQNARLIDPPEQQTIIKKNAPAFEATTRIDVRRDGNQIRIHSFVSTSTINRKRIQSLNTPHTMPRQSTSIASPFLSVSPFFANQTFRNPTTSTQETIDVAKIAHELSISVHQKVHDFYQLVNCTTIRRTDQVNTLIFTGESVEQTSFTTVCQEAIGKAEKQNNQGMKKESENPTFSSGHMTNTTEHEFHPFSAEETAQRLSKAFQVSFENQHNATIDPLNPVHNVHNQVTETFWNDLTKLFYQFFSQHEHVAPTQEKKEPSGSLLSYFADWLLSSFSVNYGEQIPTNSQLEKKLNVPVSNYHTNNSLPTKTSQKKSKKKKQKNNQQELSLEMVPELGSKAKAVLLPERESYLSPFWHLTEDFFEKVEGFIEHFKFNVFPQLGTEARPIPAPVEEREVLISWKKLSVGTTIKINQIMSDYLNNLPSTVPNKGRLPDFWYDYETFQLRHKIQEVNQKVKDYLIGQGVPCAELSVVELLNAIENWEGKDGLVTKMNRRKQLASVIREAFGLPKIDLTYAQATNILLQWRNNNIFQEYSFEDRKPPTPKESQPTTLEELAPTQATTVNTQMNATTEATTVNTQMNATTLTSSLPPEIDAPKLEYYEDIPREIQEQLEKVVQTYIHGYSVAKLLRETIPPNLPFFWYDLEIFENRDQLGKVNKELKAFLCEEKQWCQDMTDQTLFLKIRSWVESKKAQTTRTRRKKIAGIILKASGLQTRKLTNSEAKSIILQWQNNNLFKSYKFKEIAPIHTETTVSLNENQSNVTTERTIETNSVKDQVEMASFSTTPSSSTSVKLSADALKINSIITAFFAGKSSPVPLSEKLPLFMDDAEVYKKRNETDHVNDKVKEFLCNQKEPCDGLSPLPLINAIYWWVWKEGEEKKKTRSKEIAEVILSSSGLTGQEVSDDRASAILQQWRNNNIFKGYQFKEPKQIPTETTASLKETPSDLTTELLMETSSLAYQVEEILPPIVQPSTLSEEISEDMKKINSMITAYFEGKPSPVPISEKLPLIIYDEELYKKRNETQSINEEVKKFLCKQKVACEKSTPPQLIKATEEWIRKGRNKGKVARSKQVADTILSPLRLAGQEISEDRAASVLLQWRENNIFQGYQFKYLMKTYHETPIGVHDTIVVLNESQLNTTSHVSQLKKGNGSDLPHSNITTGLPIDTRSDKSSTPKFQSPDTYDKRYLAFTKKINSIITAFLEGKSSPVPTTEVLPIYYHEGTYAVYQQRHETPKVNAAIKKLLCDQKIPCEGLSLLQLITATQRWIRKEGKETEKIRSKQVAELILTTSGLTSHTITHHQAHAIFSQWRDNNIFKDYEFQKPSSDDRMYKTSGSAGAITSTNIYTYGVVSLAGAALVSKFHGAYLNKHPMTLPTYEPLLPFWFDFALFQKRNETEKVNEAVSQFLAKQQEFSEGLPAQPPAIIAHDWVHDEQTDAEILARQKQLAPIILEEYGIRRNLTATEAVNTVLQWESNNVFKDYTFIELKQSSLSEKQFRNEPLTENSKMEVVPDTIKDPDLEFVHGIMEDVTNNITPTTRYSEPLPIFYYHLLLFQKRNETSAVNKKMQEFFTKEGMEIKESSGSELEKTTRQWLEKGSTHDVSDKYERKQFLVYFLLKAYGVEDLRLGEFLSSIKVQAILDQWKANTLLEGYTYQEITHTTIHHQLSQAEDQSVIRLNEQKKESQQIYADFIHDRTPTISKNQLLQTIYYYRTLFEKREKTPAVNELIRKFLLEQKVSLKDPSASELVRGMQGWILEGPTYGSILEREKKIAQLLQKAYGLVVKEKTVKEARYLLLQWENNNAQVGYSYKDPNTFEAIDISVVEGKEEEKERIEAFTRENKEGHSTNDPNKAKEDLITERTKEQKEDLLKKIVAFLGRKNIKVDVSKPNELVVKTARWTTKEVEGKETIDFTKVKMLANIILEKKEDAVISKEKAQAIFMKWLLDTTEEEAPTFTSTEQIKEEMTQSTQSTQITETTTVQPSVSEGQKPKYEVPNWRDKNMRIQVAQFFRQKGVLKEESTLENILLAMGKWFTEERGEMTLSYSKLQSLAKVILKELNLYGGEGNETISDKNARITIMKWVTENILGSSMEGYMLKKILDSPNSSEFTIGNLRKLFETDALINFSTFRVSKEELTIVQKLWSLFLKEVLPNYFLETSALADELPISNYDSLMQLTGAKLLADLDIHTQFNQAEIQTFGTFIWDKISKYGIKKVEELRYTVLPALLAIAQLEPDLLRKALEKGDYQEVALSTLIEYHQNGYLQLKEHQDTLYDLFTAYQKEVLNWRRKQALAKEVVQTYLQHAKGKALFPAFVLEQDYLLGKSLSINDYTSPDLGEWYKRLTKAVSDSFYPLDQKLIEFALNAFDPEEREFIFSLETELYEASAQLEHTQVTPLISSYPIVIQTQLKLEQTDLFVAVQGEEERWYALKKLDMDGGYVFYRVDKNPLAYLQYGLLDQKDIWGQGYKKVGDSILLIGNKYFTFITHIDRSKKLSQGEERQPLIDAFSRKHSDKLYDELYKSGNDKAILEQIWDVAKHLIPFYDCVTASIDKDVAVAVPSCTIDIVLLIPVFGQVTSLSSKFAFGMAKAMATGGIRNAIRQGARFTPKISEVKSVLVNIRRYLDPGIETIADGSKFVVKELVALKNEVWVKKNVKQLLKKIDGLVKETPTLPKDVIRTY
ncbi:QWxxN domain, partial [Candidatus Enterococcus wittei]